jgi:hypothetical protein
MTAKKLTVAASLLVATTLGMTTASLAQSYYPGTYGQGYYDYYQPGPGMAPYNYGPPAPDCDRGGPGPRSGCGSGFGIGAVR